jgi:hypothetical protein
VHEDHLAHRDREALKEEEAVFVLAGQFLPPPCCRTNTKGGKDLQEQYPPHVLPEALHQMLPPKVVLQQRVPDVAQPEEHDRRREPYLETMHVEPVYTTAGQISHMCKTQMRQTFKITYTPQITTLFDIPTEPSNRKLNAPLALPLT